MTTDEIIIILIKFFIEDYEEDPGGVSERLVEMGHDPEEVIQAAYELGESQ